MSPSRRFLALTFALYVSSVLGIFTLGMVLIQRVPMAQAAADVLVSQQAILPETKRDRTLPVAAAAYNRRSRFSTPIP